MTQFPRLRARRRLTAHLAPVARRFRRLLGPSVALLFCLGASACGGGGADHVDNPEVRNFSPTVSPIDFGSLTQNPTFTNGALTVSTHPSYPGKFVVFFNDGTEIDPSSVFLGGDPFLGPDPNAFQVTREIPGTGNQLIPVEITVEPTVIIAQPLPPYSSPDGSGGFITNMPDGQYTIGVFSGLRSVAGDSLRVAPVFHTITVGASDALAPRVLATTPSAGQVGVGAGRPPPPPPPGAPADSLAAITTNIFGPPTPDIRIRFTEGIAASSVTSSNVTVVDAGTPGGAPPQILPAPGFPKLKSELDGQTLPSNGHEIVWRATPTGQGFPFGTQIQASTLGRYNTQANMDADPGGMNPDNPSPIQDLAGNFMSVTHVVQFETIGLPDLPENPLPEYSIWWSASNRVGAIDIINHAAISDQALGTPYPNGIPENVLPPFTDQIAHENHIVGFDPREIILDPRHDSHLTTVPWTCHTYVYVQSLESGQVAILFSRNALPVALINTPSPGGIGLHCAAGATDMLLATNASANTFTAFSLSNTVAGRPFLTLPIFVSKVQPTGNTPTAITVSVPASGTAVPPLWNRDPPGGGSPGPAAPLIMWIDFSDGTVNTIRMADAQPVRTFNLGADSSPNDISFSPCFGGPGGGIMFGAISQGGSGVDEGKVSFYVSGPGCQTGSQTSNNPDAISGSTNEPLDGPDGIDENSVGGKFVLPGGAVSQQGAIFALAESGSQRNGVVTLGLETGQINLPRIVARFSGVGDNPTNIAHRPSWTAPTINDPSVFSATTDCLYSVDGLGAGGVRLWQWQTTPTGIVPLLDGQLNGSADMYVCAQGSNQVTVMNMVSGTKSFYSPVPIPGVRRVGSQASQ